jgi:hypothetical protein
MSQEETFGLDPAKLYRAQDQFTLSWWGYKRGGLTEAITRGAVPRPARRQGGGVDGQHHDRLPPEATRRSTSPAPLAAEQGRQREARAMTWETIQGTAKIFAAADLATEPPALRWDILKGLRQHFQSDGSFDWKCRV